MLKQDNYFQDTEYISNSQLRNFVSYNKWGQRILTPDIYMAYKTWKVKFKVNEAIIIWKAIDEFYDKTNDLFLDKKKLFTKYKPVARRNWKEKEWIVEITKSMEKDILAMLEWGSAFNRFQELIKNNDVKCQTILQKEVELTNKSWEVKKVKLKWLPDFINHKKKVIVDLKTTWSLDMVIENLQFKGKAIKTANYLRQLALYNFLSWWNYDGVIALLSPKGVKWIDVPNDILLDVWEIMKEDIIDLANFIQNPEIVDETIFYEEDELSLV